MLMVGQHILKMRYYATKAKTACNKVNMYDGLNWMGVICL